MAQFDLWQDRVPRAESGLLLVVSENIHADPYCQNVMLLFEKDCVAP